jgi:hypothetical protein
MKKKCKFTEPGRKERLSDGVKCNGIKLGVGNQTIIIDLSHAMKQNKTNNKKSSEYFRKIFLIKKKTLNDKKYRFKRDYKRRQNKN